MTATTTTPVATGTIDVDELCPIAKTSQVFEDWNAMLNQTNIGANNNKFYVIQLLEKGGKYHAWFRWGRVGEDGQSSLTAPLTLDKAKAEFQKKFKDKTSNNWEDRATFKAKAGKYTLIEIAVGADKKKAEEIEEKLKSLDAAAPKVKPVAPEIMPSKLAPDLQRFMELIFDHNMFKGAMADFEIDVEKMPLGQLSKTQVQKGFDALTDIENAIKAGSTSGVNAATSTFYTLIPHAFGRRRPPPITTAEMIQKKRDMLNVLADIEIALNMQQAGAAAPAAVVANQKPHPLDENYGKLDADLELVPKGSKEWEFIEKYIAITKDSHTRMDLLDVFKVNRRSEHKRYSAHDDLGNRKLLWHGTNVAVVAAILGTGLRIMPHSGGRVGKGIYLASENRKSYQYVGRSQNIGIMFLCEGVLGKEHHITRDDSSLVQAPKGFDSIVAKGHTEPDSAHDLEWDFDGRKVIIPQGAPKNDSKFSKSSFVHSEYLVYKESQVRIRYVLKIRM